MHLKLRTGGQVDIAAQATVVGLGAVLIANEGGCLTVFDNAVMHHELTGNIHSAACAAFISAGGCVSHALCLTANDLAAVHIEEAILGNADGSTAGVNNLGGIDGAAVQRQCAVTHHDTHTHGAVAGGCDHTGLGLAGVHNGQLDTGVVHDQHAGAGRGLHTVAVQIQADLSVLREAGLALGFHIGHQLIMAGVLGQGLGIGPLVPGNRFLTVLALSLVGEHIVGALTQINMGDVAIQVGNGHHAVVLDGFSHATDLAGLAGHIPNTVGIQLLQHHGHTVKILRGVGLDHGLGRALHEEAPCHLLQGHLTQQEHIGDETVFIILQAHELLMIHGVDSFSVHCLQRQDLAIMEKPNMEIPIALGLTGGHTGLGLTGILLHIQVPVELVGLHGVFRGGHGGLGSLSAGALCQHQAQHHGQNDHSRNDPNEQRFLVFHKNTPF